MIGITSGLIPRPPVRYKSVPSIASSMATIDMKDIPIAALKASRVGRNEGGRLRMKVSNATEVARPLTIGSPIVSAFISFAMPRTWNAASVPNSQIEQPSKRQAVLTLARRHVAPHFQLTPTFDCKNNEHENFAENELATFHATKPTSTFAT